MLVRPSAVVFATALSTLAFAQTLTVKDASASQVELAWTGGNSVVERRVAGTEAFAPLTQAQAATAAPFIDKTVQGMTTYQYRLRSASGALSNVVTVGPPPFGFSRVVAPSKPFADNQQYTGFGNTLELVIDENGDPALVYHARFTWREANEKVHEVWFVRWDRPRYRWTEPVKITNMSVLPLYARGLAVGYDPGTHSFALAVDDEVDEKLHLFVSGDKGATWTLKHSLGKEDDKRAIAPSLALRDGVLHLSYVRPSKTCFYLTGKIAEAPSQWKTTALPMLATSVDGISGSASTALALDPSGVPGIAYWTEGPDYNRALAFWRPGWTAPVDAMNTAGRQSDFLDVRLRFAGNQPRLLAHMDRDAKLYYERDWVSTSNDGGKTWSKPPANLPRDGGEHSVDRPFDLALDAQGGGVVVFASNGGQGNDKCFGPKISRSADLRTWKTCGIDTQSMGFSGSVSDVQARYAPDNKLYAVWPEPLVTKRLGNGILFWRQP